MTQKEVKQRGGETEREKRTGDTRSRMDLSLLEALEREHILEVLQRDKQLRLIEENRIRLLIYFSFRDIMGNIPVSECSDKQV